MLSGNTAKLRQAAKRGDVAPAGASQVGRDITAELRRLQSQGAPVLDVDGIVTGLAPALRILLEAGHLVSLSRTRDGRSIRLSVLDGKDWIEFFTADPDHAADLGEGVAAALSGSV